MQVERREALWIWQGTIALARDHRLTAYDAAYLDLARREQLSLASLDDDLRKAGLALGVATLAL
jgi:predicted nucleic acid-binding protein